MELSTEFFKVGNHYRRYIVQKYLGVYIFEEKRQIGVQVELISSLFNIMGSGHHKEFNFLIGCGQQVSRNIYFWAINFSYLVILIVM